MRPPLSKNQRAGAILLASFGLIVIAWVVMYQVVSVATLKREYPEVVRSGALISFVQRGKQRRTSLAIETDDGRQFRYRIDPPAQSDELIRARDRAKSAPPERVTFVVDERRGDLLELRTADGKQLISRQQLLEGRCRRAWFGLGVGLVMLTTTSYLLAQLLRIKK